VAEMTPNLDIENGEQKGEDEEIERKDSLI